MATRARARPNDVVDYLQQPHVTDLESANKNSQNLSQLVATLKNPAQAEWEQLWYLNSAASFQKISHLFPSYTAAKSTSSSTTKGISISEPTLDLFQLKAEDRAVFEEEEEERSTRNISLAPKSRTEAIAREQRALSARNDSEKFGLLLGLPTYEEYLAQKSIVPQPIISSGGQSKRQLKRQAKFAARAQSKIAKSSTLELVDEGYASDTIPAHLNKGMSHQKTPSVTSIDDLPKDAAQHRPLVVGLTKSRSSSHTANMASSSDAAALNKQIAENVKSNVQEAAPSEDNPTAPASQQPKKEKKEKAPKQPKQPKGGAAAPAPTSPALIDLRVGHILRAIAHPNADSLYVSTIAMGDPEGTDHTSIDEETGRVVRTVCSGLNGLVPLADMQDRKIVVVANLKPVNMRSIKSAAMVLAASPKQEEGADPHAPDRVVELVEPPAGSEAGDKVYFEGWPYGEGKGPEKTLNPKKKQWEAIQPGFYTSEDLVVGFDATKCDEVEGSEKGQLVVEGKGPCKVKTLKGAVVR